CKEPEHIAKNCLLEKVEILEQQYKLRKQSNKEKKQSKNINLAKIESSEKDEV
ncbi:14142_t:CDS:1, partial [Gigaspora margarita]